MHDGSRSRRDRDQKEIGREVKTSVKCNRKTENEQIRRESSKKQGDSLESDIELKDKENSVERFPYFRRSILFCFVIYFVVT